MPLTRAHFLVAAWHAPVCQALLQAGAGLACGLIDRSHIIMTSGSAPLSVEKVLRSNGSLTLEQMTGQYDMGAALSFEYHTIPQNGSYTCDVSTPRSNVMCRAVLHLPQARQ